MNTKYASLLSALSVFCFFTANRAQLPLEDRLNQARNARKDCLAHRLVGVSPLSMILQGIMLKGDIRFSCDKESSEYLETLKELGKEHTFALEKKDTKSAQLLETMMYIESMHLDEDEEEINRPLLNITFKSRNRK